MTIKSFVHDLARCTLAALATIGIAACDSIVYDDEGDCSVSYKVKFVDDYNLLRADAFDSEVERVTLYAVDGNGTVVWQRTATRGEIQSNGGYMDLPVKPGEYDLLVWAEGSTDAGATAWLPMGNSAPASLSRYLPLADDRSTDSDVSMLFHGCLHATLPGEEDPVTFNRQYVYPIQLCKNTNSLRIVVQQVYGSVFDPHDLEFMLVADNTQYDPTNTIVRRGNATYRAWHTSYYEAEMETTRATTSYPTVVAELTTARLMDGDDVRVVVNNKATGVQLLSFPLIDYLLMVRSQHFAGMGNQEYLDRQNDCSIVFFLDESKPDIGLTGKYIDVSVGVLSWRIVLQSTPL